jgi:hypothetical protein
MKDIQFVTAEELSTIEQYGAALLSSMLSVQTLGAFHIAAFNKGLLDEDEAETGKTILWELQRLQSLYKAQIQHVLDRTQINEEEIMAALRKMMPHAEIPKKRSRKKKEEVNG